MIVCHAPDGRITLVYSDPVPDDLSAYLTEQGVDHVVSPMTGSASEIIANCYVADGAVAPRPVCDAAVAADGLRITVSGAPDGSSARMIFDPGDVLEVQMDVPLDDGIITLDEGGAVRLVILPPWPMMEASHDLSI